MTFTRPFDQTPDVIAQIINNSNTFLHSVKIHNITKLGFDYLGRRTNGTSVSNTGADFYYLALGNR